MLLGPLYPTIKLKVPRHSNDELKYDNDILNGKLQLLDLFYHFLRFHASLESVTHTSINYKYELSLSQNIIIKN